MISFNLTIDAYKEHTTEIKKFIFCRIDEILAHTRRCAASANKNLAINHVTISHVGEVSIILNGNFFKAPEDIDNLFRNKNSNIYKMFKLSILNRDNNTEMIWEPIGYT